MTNNAPVETREFGQFIFETINCDCADEKFLEKTALFVGKVVQKFNSLERELNSTICSMFIDDYDPMGLVVICGMTYSQKVNLLERLLKHDLHMMGKKDEWFDDLFLKLRSAGRLRNVVVHADWQSSEEDGNTPSSMRLKDGVLQQEFFSFTPKALREIIREIDKTKRLVGKFEDMNAKLMDCGERKGKRSV